MTVGRPSNAMAAQLRRDQTEVERRLWAALRDRRLLGAKFRRQVPIGAYVVDFVCLGSRLIVEIDGGQHGGPADVGRQRWLEQQGFQVIRFWNNEVNANICGVLGAIAERLKQPSSSPSPAGGRRSG